MIYLFNESYIPGATAVGIKFNDGVLLAAEKRVAHGRFIASKNTNKVFSISKNTGAAFAGMIGDMQILTREISAHIKIRELDIKREMAPNSIAKLLSVIMFERRFAPYLTQIILGGINGKASIYVLDPVGSVIPDEYASVGSGAEAAIGVIEAFYKDNMNEEEVKELAIKAIKAAIERDAGSGDGIDMLIIKKSGSNKESVKL